MKLRYKILTTVLALLVIAVGALAVTLTYTSACTPAPPLPAGATAFKAAVHTCYGAPDVLQVADVEKPEPGENEILVRVHAASVNPLDWHFLQGSPFIMRLGVGLGKPTVMRLGVDYAGTVEAVGSSVTRFAPGDEVFGGRTGAFAQYVVAGEGGSITSKPANVSFAEAAALPIAAVTALQAVRDQGKIETGDKVLINGASGGVGTFAVQIAKSRGAEVTGVCSTRNVELVRSLGADRVIDYTKENYTEGGQRYDVIIDMVGNQPFSAMRDVLVPDGLVVMVGGPSGDWLGPLMNPLKAMFVNPFIDEHFGFFMADTNHEDLALLAGMVADGKLQAVIDRHYPLSEIAEAMAYSEGGHARGKIIVDMP